MESKVIKTSCSMCHGSCRILGYIKNGKAIKVEGDPEGPINRGTLCAKGLSSRRNNQTRGWNRAHIP